jgi:hypothetical protein
MSDEPRSKHSLLGETVLHLHRAAKAFLASGQRVEDWTVVCELQLRAAQELQVEPPATDSGAPTEPVGSATEATEAALAGLAWAEAFGLLCATQALGETFPPGALGECLEDAASCDCAWHENARRAEELNSDEGTFHRDLAAILVPLFELEEKATPGPWKAGRADMISYAADGGSAFKNVYADDPNGRWHMGSLLPAVVARGEEGLEGEAKCIENAQLIAAARNAIPALRAAFSTLHDRKRSRRG